MGERRGRRQRYEQRFERESLFERDLGRVADHTFVFLFDAAAQSVSEQPRAETFGGGLVLFQHLAELARAVEGTSVGELARRVDLEVAVEQTITADSVVTLQREAQRIEDVVADGAG